MPCNTLPCINGGTCINVNTHSYRCACTHEWHGDICDRRTVQQNTLIQEVKSFIANSGNTCKPKELKDWLGDSSRGRYPSYMWVVHCQFKSGSRAWSWFESRIIYVEYDNFDVWVAWQDMYSPPGIVSRYTQGETRATQHFANANLACNAVSMRDKIKEELNNINLDYTMVMVMRSSGFSYYGSAPMIFDFKRNIDCPKSADEIALTYLSSFNIFALIGNAISGGYSLTRRETMYVIVIGAKERSQSKKRAIQSAPSNHHLNRMKSMSQLQWNTRQNHSKGERKKRKGKANQRMTFHNKHTDL